MSPEAQRVAIAEAVGYRVQAFAVTLSDGKMIYRGAKEVTDLLPDYLTDLNAMHEAVAHAKAADPTFMVAYLMHLQVTSGDRSFPGMNVGTLVEATAAQRAEAFLKTLGLWTEEAGKS